MMNDDGIMPHPILLLSVAASSCSEIRRTLSHDDALRYCERTFCGLSQAPIALHKPPPAQEVEKSSRRRREEAASFNIRTD